MKIMKNDLEDNGESERKKEIEKRCLPDVPHGTGFQLFIEWLLYINSITVSFIPFMTKFWCNPNNKRYAGLWAFAVLLGGVLVVAILRISANMAGRIVGYIFW